MVFNSEQLGLWKRVFYKLCPASNVAIETHIASTLTRVSAEAYETRRPRIRRHIIYFWMLSRYVVIGTIIALLAFWGEQVLKMRAIEYIDENYQELSQLIHSGANKIGGWFYWGDSLMVNLLSLSEILFWALIFIYTFNRFYWHYTEYQSDYIVPHSRGLVVFYRNSFFSVGQKSFEFNFLNELAEETSFWGSVFGYGTLKISKTGNSTPYEFEYCKNVHDKWKQIKELQKALEHSGGMGDGEGGEANDFEEDIQEASPQQNSDQEQVQAVQQAPAQETIQVVPQTPIQEQAPMVQQNHVQDPATQHGIQDQAQVIQQANHVQNHAAHHVPQEQAQVIQHTHPEQVQTVQQAPMQEQVQATQQIPVQEPMAQQAVQEQVQVSQQVPTQEPVAQQIIQEQPQVVQTAPVQEQQEQAAIKKEEPIKINPHLSLKDIHKFVSSSMKNIFD